MLRNDRYPPSKPFWHVFFYYMIGSLATFAIIYLSLILFRGYFYGSGREAAVPALIQLLISLITGFIVSAMLTRKIRKSNIPRNKGSRTER